MEKHGLSAFLAFRFYCFCNFWQLEGKQQNPFATLQATYFHLHLRAWWGSRAAELPCLLLYTTAKSLEIFMFVSRKMPNNVLMPQISVILILPVNGCWPAQWVQLSFVTSHHRLASFWRQTSMKILWSFLLVHPLSDQRPRALPASLAITTLPLHLKPSGNKPIPIKIAPCQIN